MFSVALLDARRVLTSKTTWVALLIALSILGFQSVKEARTFSFAVSPSRIDASGYAPFLPTDAVPDPVAERDVLARDASPALRLMTSFWYFDTLALAAIVVMGGFFAQDIRSGYTAMRRCRGLSPRRMFLANAVSIGLVSSAFSIVGIGFQYAICLAVNPRAINEITEGQMVLQQVFFLPQVAAARPLVYICLFAVLYTGVLAFLGLLGHLVARVSRDVLLASLAPAALIYVVGGYAAAKLPWPFWAFDFDNLAFAERFITEPVYVVKYVGGYFVWIAVLMAAGLMDPHVRHRIGRTFTWAARS